MKLRSTRNKYGLLAQAFHWLIVIGIIVQYFLAGGAEDHENAATPNGASGLDAMGLHESIGMLLLLLALLRMLWRLLDQRPDWPANMKPYERFIAHGMHAALYVLLVTVPLAGWASRSAEGKPVDVFGIVTAPAIVGAQQQALPAATAQPAESGDEDEDKGREGAGEQYAELHEVLFNLLVLLAVLHLLAGLKHHFVDKDSVLRSMSPSGGE